MVTFEADTKHRLNSGIGLYKVGQQERSH